MGFDCVSGLLAVGEWAGAEKTRAKGSVGLSCDVVEAGESQCAVLGVLLPSGLLAFLCYDDGLRNRKGIQRGLRGQPGQSARGSW